MDYQSEQEGKNENEYVFEKSVELDKDRLDSVRRSIENERQKAGVLLGFIVLELIEGASRLDHVCFTFRFPIIISFVVAIVFSLISFKSSPMKNSLATDGNFKRTWEDKESFLRLQHDVMIDIINHQKEHLSRISQSMFCAMIAVGIAMLLICVTIVL